MNEYKAIIEREVVQVCRHLQKQYYFLKMELSRPTGDLHTFVQVDQIYLLIIAQSPSGIEGT